MAAVNLDSSIQWLNAEESEVTQSVVWDGLGQIDVVDVPQLPGIVGTEVGFGQAMHDLDGLINQTDDRTALWDAFGSGNRQAVAAQVSRVLGVVRHSGTWGDILDTQRVNRKVQVVGLSAPDLAGSKTAAKYSFTTKGSKGLKLTVAVLSFGTSKTYTVTQELTLECGPGESKVGCLYVPLDRITQSYRPPGSDEWFQMVRYAPVPQNPGAPGLGATADTSSSGELLEGASRDSVPVGGGSASISASVTKEASISFSAEIGAKFLNDAAALSISATVEGSVSVAVEYTLPAGDPCELRWLYPLAGACVEKGVLVANF